MTSDYDIAIVGSGFAGSLLARLLARTGRSVVLIESAKHPRFALGESSTPLAAIALERMARRFEIPELAQFATYGRWQASQAELGCGLKRGFSYYGHARGARYRNDDADSHRFLVAASPSDALADLHWVRADVDARFARRAVEDGVTLFEEHRLVDLREHEDAIELHVSSARGEQPIRAGFVVDASGGAVADALGVSSIATCDHPTTLIYGHFRNVQPFASANKASNAAPYPEFAAANHHLFQGGWIYLLPFDDGRVSAGAILEAERAHADPVQAWRHALTQVPTLDSCFERTTAIDPIGIGQRQFTRQRRRLASGNRWALLPHAYAFQDPMFSTGIAWSLLAVERLTEILGREQSAPPQTERIYKGLRRYADLLSTEAIHTAALCAGARSLYGDFDRFVEWAKLYFIAASYSEARQRITDPPNACWEGFLGSTDPHLAGLFERAPAWFENDLAQTRSHLREKLAVRDVGGFTHNQANRLLDVDLEALIAAAPKLGLSCDELRALLPSILRGQWQPQTASPLTRATTALRQAR